MRLTILAAAAAAALVLAAAAAAVDEPSASATATNGTLEVISGVLVLPRAVELKGVWIDESVVCTTNRTLRVAIEVSFIPPTGRPRRIGRTRTGTVMNCAEGGPNFGFQLTARGLRLACPNGRWRPGRYDFVTRTTETGSGLRSTASLGWEKGTAC
jgi:hypothetical protein